VAGDPNYPIDTAAINWLDSSGEVHIRVYSSDGYTVTERCWDGSGWSDGSFTQPGSVVSATCWQGSGGLSIRVYCTVQDATTEWCIDQGGGWYQGAYTTT
jgi:Fungal fucose-specific lectin